MRHHRALRSAGWLAAAALLVVALILPASALAWTQPSVTPNCAPDANHFAFTVNLDTNIWDQSGYQYDYAFGAQQPTSGWTHIDGEVGANKLVTYRAQGLLWVRWTQDTSSVASATPDTRLCGSSPSPSGSVEGNTGHPDITPPPTDMAAGTTTSGSGLPLIVAAMACVFAAALVLTPSRARRRR